MKRPCAYCGLKPAAYTVTEFCSIDCQARAWAMLEKVEERPPEDDVVPAQEVDSEQGDTLLEDRLV